MERNHRIAKAYARSSVITINGSKTGFDGYRIGINGLEAGGSDPKAEQIKKLIGQVSIYLESKYLYLVYIYGLVEMEINVQQNGQKTEKSP